MSYVCVLCGNKAIISHVSSLHLGSSGLVEILNSLNV